MTFLAIQLLNGLASASSLFLISAGLSLIFGVTRIVNFAHGSLYMLGAFLGWTLIDLSGASGSLPLFVLAVGLTAVLTGLLGGLIEITLLRRVYRAPELFQLLLTFGVVLVVGQIAQIVWGPDERLITRPPGLDGSIPLLGQRFPVYDLVLIALGPLVLAGLTLLMRRTRFGILTRAATEDRTMTGALGVDQAWLFTAVFALGSALAGLAGALELPRSAASHGMDLAIIADVFVVTVVGGLGSITGAFLAAVLIGVLGAFGIWAFPGLTFVLPFLIMAAVLVVRPEGLLGSRARLDVRTLPPERALRAPSSRARACAVLVIAALLLLPAVASPYFTYLMAEVFALALFAASLHLLLGIGGLISFGHAAYFGLGAYVAALTVTTADLPMELALVLAPLAGFALGFLFGWFCVRLSGVYLAMLSLAFAQILQAIAAQWVAVTGGDNGITGVWPSDWAADPFSFYYLALGLALAGVAVLRRAIYAPFGYGLRAGRDAPMRAEAIGIHVGLHRWLAFALAGGIAGLGGALLAFHRGSVDPTWLGISRSVDALVMVLLGGIDSLVGPLLGAAAYHLLAINAATLTERWPLVVGLVLIVLCLAAPGGLSGLARRLQQRMIG
ncbi:ABC transporter permease [Marinivivus vitaminiproducens]|uniref:ABC transporter permease n=1 Tax=Marinivivus vitaminiproducens TaxID=3035935 RepID=UPI0027A1AE7F|nr:ABC transporter permease [Geminicoccaceae bacterium SCSIO 64248]